MNEKLLFPCSACVANRKCRPPSRKTGPSPLPDRCFPAKEQRLHRQNVSKSQEARRTGLERRTPERKFRLSAGKSKMAEYITRGNGQPRKCVTEAEGAVHADHKASWRDKTLLYWLSQLETSCPKDKQSVRKLSRTQKTEMVMELDNVYL